MSLTANETIVSSRKVIAVTTGTNLPPHRGIWVGTGGNLDVTFDDGTQVTIPGVAAGTLLPLSVRQVRGTSTASGLMLWL